LAAQVEEIKVKVTADPKQYSATMGKIQQITAKTREVVNKARGISQAASGSSGATAKEWERYRSIAIRELETVQRKVAQAQKKMDDLRPQLFSRDSGAADEFIQTSVRAGWSDKQIEAGLAQQEAASLNTKAGRAYTAAKVQLEQYSAAVASATENLARMNAQVDASRAAEQRAKAQAKAAKEQARQQAAVARQNASQARLNQRYTSQGVGMMMGLPRTSSMALVGIYALVRAIQAMVRGLFEAAMTNDQFKESVAQIKGNLAVAFQPIIQAILPALQTLVNWLATATNYISQFVAALFGMNYADAVAGAKAQQDAIAGVGGAAAKANKSLAKFDELNILQAKTSGGGGGGAGITFPDANVTTPPWLQGAIDIVDRVKTAFGGFITFWKGQISSHLPGFKQEWGDFVESFNGSPVGDAFKGISNWLKNIDWDAVYGNG